MKIGIGKITFTFLPVIVMLACNSRPVADNEQDEKTGERFITAFYSFNAGSLRAILAAADSSAPNILFYQLWASCANYKPLTLHQPLRQNDSLLLFPVTVEDDLMKALDIDFNVTDTFHLTFSHGRIVSVSTSSNDLPEYYEALNWVKKNRADSLAVPCGSMPGSDACACVKQMLNGFSAYKLSKQ